MMISGFRAPGGHHALPSSNRPPCRSRRLTFDAGIGVGLEAEAGRAAAHGTVVTRPTHAVLQRAVTRVQDGARVEAHAPQAEPVTGTLAVTAALLLV